MEQYILDLARQNSEWCKTLLTINSVIIGVIALSTEYTKTAISKALEINRNYLHELLNKTKKETTMIERIRKKYQGYKLRFDELTREFPKYGYRRICAMMRRRHLSIPDRGANPNIPPNSSTILYFILTPKKRNWH